MSYCSTSSIHEVDLVPSDVVADLRCIAEKMISAGYVRECVQVYGGVRKSAANSSFRRLGVEKLSIGDVQRLKWDELEEGRSLLRQKGVSTKAWPTPHLVDGVLAEVRPTLYLAARKTTPTRRRFSAAETRATS